MTINQNGIFVEPGQGHCYWFGQDLYTFKAVGEDTGEAYALCEVVVAPQGVLLRIDTVGKMNRSMCKTERLNSSLTIAPLLQRLEPSSIRPKVSFIDLPIRPLYLPNCWFG